MNGAHTQGPWSTVAYLDEHNGRGRNVLVTEGTKGALHRVHAANHCVAYTVPSLADARLIAAAPTMRDYIQEKANGGDLTARAILATL